MKVIELSKEEREIIEIYRCLNGHGKETLLDDAYLYRNYSKYQPNIIDFKWAKKHLENK